MSTASISSDPVIASACDPDRRFAILPVNRIRANPHEARRDRDPESEARMTEHIRKNGVRNPIIVQPAIDEGFYDKLAGGTRLRCAIAAGRTEVPALIVTKPLSEGEVCLFDLEDNIHRRNLSWLDTGEALLKTMALLDISQSQIAERMELSNATVSQMLQVTRLSERVKELMRGRSLHDSVAAKLVKINDFPDEQWEMAESAAKGGMSRAQVDAAIAKLVKPRSYTKKATDKITLVHKSGCTIQVKGPDLDTIRQALSWASRKAGAATNLDELRETEK